jgi:hypothetical protein
MLVGDKEFSFLDTFVSYEKMKFCGNASRTFFVTLFVYVIVIRKTFLRRRILNIFSENLTKKLLQALCLSLL